MLWNIESDLKKIPVVSEYKYPNEAVTIDCKALETHDLDSCDCESKVLLNHIGHIGTVTDFDWNQVSPWTIISASDDSEPFN